MSYPHGITVTLFTCILFLTPTDQFRITNNDASLNNGGKFILHPVNYPFNTYPITLDGHYDDEARKWSKIQPGEILLGDLEQDIDGNYSIKTNVSGYTFDISIPYSDTQGIEYDFPLNNPYTTNISDEVSLSLDKSKERDYTTKQIMLCSKNMTLEKSKSRMICEKFDWEGTVYNPADRQHYIHPKNLEKKQIEVLVTDADPENDLVKGLVFTHDIVEKKRREYLTIYHMFHSLSANKQYYRLKCTVDNISGKLIKLNVLNGLSGYAIKSGLLKDVRPGQALDLVTIGCDPLLERIFLSPDDGEINFNNEKLITTIESELINQLFSTNSWFKAEIMKFNETGLVVRISGIANPILAFVPINHLPYCGSSGVIDNMYIHNYCKNPKYTARYISTKLGKLSHISNYDNSIIVRMHRIFPNKEQFENKLKIQDFKGVYMELTTRPKVKWSDNMLKISDKIKNQKLEDLKSIDKDHFYPSKILFQANGHIYISVNVNMEKNFDFDNNGIIGVVPIDEYFSIAKPGALINARINKIETLKRMDHIIKHSDNVYTNDDKFGPMDFDDIHVLWMSFQAPKYFRNLFRRVDQTSNFTFLPYYSDNHPEVYTDRIAEGMMGKMFKFEYDEDIFWANRDEAIRRAFTKDWFNMYENEVLMINDDPVSQIYEILEDELGPLAQFIDSMNDFYKFREIPIRQLLRYFDKLMVLLTTYRRIPLEKIYYKAMIDDSFYKIMSATIVPRDKSHNFLSVSEVETVLNKFLPEDLKSRRDFINKALFDTVRALNISKSDGYASLTQDVITPSNIAISILVTLVNPKYGLMALVRDRHRKIPNEVFSTSRQKIHYYSRIGFNHIHDTISRRVKVLGANPLSNIKSMPPWPYLVKSTQSFYAHLTDMGLFDLAQSYNKLLTMMKSDEDLKNIPDTIPEDFCPDYPIGVGPLYKDVRRDEIENIIDIMKEKLKSNNGRYKDINVDKLPKDFKIIYSAKEINTFFEQLNEMNQVYGLRIPLF